MALLCVIRRWHFREHLSIREICRRTGLSRNTIRKYLRAGGVEPKFNVRIGRASLIVCRSVIGLAEDGVEEEPQAEADDEAATR